MTENQYGNPIWFLPKPVWVAREASPSASSLYDAIAWHAVSNEDDECFPSKWTLALFLNLDPRSITDLLFELEYIGAVRVVSERISSGRRNRYQVAVDSQPFHSQERTYRRRKAWEKLELRLLEQWGVRDEKRRHLEKLRDVDDERKWVSSPVRNSASPGVRKSASYEQEPAKQEPVERDVREVESLAEDLVQEEADFLPPGEEEADFLSSEPDEVRF